jgi:nucleotide-binding universal stress UspA family protein
MLTNTCSIVGAKRPISHVLPARILVAVDAEGLADHALEAGLDLAQSLGAKIELVHAFGEGLPHWKYEDSPQAVAADVGIVTTALAAMTAHVDGVLKERGNKQVRAQDIVRVIAGPPAQVVLDEATRMRADLIVMGTHRRRGIVDFGSTVRAVLANAPGSVWIQTQPVQPIRRILVPVDLSNDSLEALAQACSLAVRMGARVRALHVFSVAIGMVPAWPDYPDFNALHGGDELRSARRAEFEKAMAAFDWRGVEHEIEFVDGEPVETILEHSRTSDLVALGTHGRTGVAALFLGNVAYSVLKRCDKPVWAIRHRERETSQPT